MYKITLKIEGMACGMCEAHVCDALRNALKPKKVTASHSKGEAVVLSEGPIEETAFAAALNGTGYALLSVSTQPYEKKGLFGFLRK